MIFIGGSGGSVSSVNGKTGTVTIDSTDVNSVSANIPQYTAEPTGFVPNQNVNLDFNGSTRVFTISPSNGDFKFFSKGQIFVKTQAETITIPNLTGEHFIYYDTNGVLSHSLTVPFFIEGYSGIAYIYYNATQQVAVRFNSEMHGCVMSRDDHYYNHRANGCKYITGLVAGNYTLIGTGSSDSDATISINNGTIADEDLFFNILNSSNPTAFNEQKISSVLYAPVLYKSGSNGEWFKNSATAFPLKNGISRPQYNYNNSGTWTTQDISNNDRFICSYVFATTAKEPIFVVMGQRDNATLEDAKNLDTYANLDLNNVPILEFKVLYKLIYQVNSTYANQIKAKLVFVEDIRGVQGIQLSAINIADHNGLSNRSASNAHPASAITFDNTNTNLTSIQTNDVIKEVNTKTDNHITNTSNPHSVTKSQVGLGNVSNTDTTTTSNITDSLNKRFVTDAQRTDITHSNRSNLDTINQNLSTTSSPTFVDITSTGCPISSIGTLSVTGNAQNNLVIPANGIVIITSSTTNFTINGIAGGVHGRCVTLINNTTNNMTIANLNAGSLAANRIDTLGVLFATNGKGCVQLVYSSTLGNWIVVSTVA